MLSIFQRAIACLFLAATPMAAQVASSTDPKPPGQLIDLDGYKLHLWCIGKGAPAVVMSKASRQELEAVDNATSA